jgi:hypothetical protein
VRPVRGWATPKTFNQQKGSNIMGLFTGLRERLTGIPREWHDRSRLEAWEAGHADPRGDVWCVTTPTGYGWQLWAPGSPYSGPGCGHFPYVNVDPAEVTFAHTDDGCEETEGGSRLSQVESWLRPWIEGVAGGRVVEMIDGFSWYGPNGSLAEYTIYARVVK